MPAFIDLTGQRFGRLVVLKQVEDHVTKGGSHQKQWLCECDCGNTTITTTQNLRCGDTKSCGCLELETKIKNGTTHGDSGKRLHTIWTAMRRRCSNPSNWDYKYYGGKGVTVCQEWNDYPVFREWAMSNGYSDDLTIDRIDPNGNYEPSNCAWVPIKAQENNRTNNRKYSYNGCTHTISEWAEIYHMPYSRLYMRLQKGLTIDEALNYTT